MVEDIGGGGPTRGEDLVHEPITEAASRHSVCCMGGIEATNRSFAKTKEAEGVAEDESSIFAAICAGAGVAAKEDDEAEEGVANEPGYSPKSRKLHVLSARS